MLQLYRLGQSQRAAKDSVKAHVLRNHPKSNIVSSRCVLSWCMWSIVISQLSLSRDLTLAFLLLLLIGQDKRLSIHPLLPRYKK